MKGNYVRAATAICVAVCGTHARATDVFNLEGFGPISRAMGGTGAAFDIGAAAMMENPATLSLMGEGRHFSLGLDVVSTDIKATNTATGETASSGNHGNNNGPYFAPQTAFVYRQGRYAFGAGIFAEGGLGTQYGGSSFLSRTSNGVDTGLDQFSRLLVLRVPFSAAYQVTDKLTVGASLDAVWTSLNLGTLLDVSQIGTLAGQGRVSGTLVPTLMGVPGLSGGYINFARNAPVGGGAQAWGIGGRLGLTYQVTPDTRIGAAYNAKTHVGDLTGQATLAAVSSVAGNIPLKGDVTVRNFQMPAQLTVGISHRFNDQLLVSADYQRVFWSSVMKDMNVGFVQSGTGANLDLSLPQNYRDISVFGIGAEYRYNAKWTFRGGFHYAQEAIPSNMLLAVVPATPTTSLTGGVSYAIGKNDVIDFALSVALRKTLANSSQPNTAVPISVTHSQVNAVIAYQKRF
ncbi:outer membrane protein transport protein [Ralstonia sp. CHL-2022]|uniref:OmpP1/FadL family transporter n=1 Tax=Ralstonia TaxID=48736 RepID=UPI0021B2C9C4|nr:MULTISPECIES: outer membrane protein transport protein [Ralstonia]MCT7294877.1 outer membrane protein transport protein [Ralstonia mojiangensis]HWV07082.1 outer membrane protein transport protein [Ralstonia sp.]